VSHRFQIYFPHVDNVYSHRSTQKYKRKPFISHYWDCRLKGRPAGTPKSDDPNKKKRKRIARERDLCDVKIKITEYLPGATREDIATHLSQQPKNDGVSAEHLLATVQATIGRNAPWDDSNTSYGGHFIQTNVRFYTIQRVNGTGPNGKEEGTGGHRHSLGESDRIKKNSVVRWLQKSDKVEKPIIPKKKPPVSYSFLSIQYTPATQVSGICVWDDCGAAFASFRHSSRYIRPFSFALSSMHSLRPFKVPQPFISCTTRKRQAFSWFPFLRFSIPILVCKYVIN
jgi:hypothetical protein